MLSQLSYSPTRTQIINTYDENYNYLSLGSSENAKPTFLNNGDNNKTPGVPIAHANIQALTHSLRFGGNWSLLIAVTKKDTIPVITVAMRMDEIIVPVVCLNNVYLNKK